jgi:hypothetical protein
MMRLRHLPLLALLVVGLAGCASVDAGYFTPVVSRDAAKLSPEAAKAIATDIAGKLSERMAAGAETIRLVVDGSPFGVAFAESLRGRGYAVNLAKSTEENKGASGTPVAYAVTKAGDAIMVRLSLPSMEITRTYSVSASGASPASPLSVMQHVREG